jgi:hypothetical protein
MRLSVSSGRRQFVKSIFWKEESVLYGGGKSNSLEL